MTAQQSKAAAAAAAELLLAAGLWDDAVNRAYYAMFDRAVKYLEQECGVPRESLRRHASVIARCSKDAVSSGRIDRQFGRAFARIFNHRLAADYGEAMTTETEARSVVASMRGFLDAVRVEPRGDVR